MEIRYQVFVSSTYTDLKSERARVAKAILDLGHFPSGMEFFPAIGVEQFEFIKSVIDLCDYYVLIIGGRYGSISEDGLSYTEKEYDYAVEKRIPICAFLHKDIGELPQKNAELSPEMKDRLLLFRQKVQTGKVVRFWDDEERLEANVIASLVHVMRESPRVGWRRGNADSSPEMVKKLGSISKDLEYYRKEHLKLYNKISGYENITNSSVDIKFITNGERHIYNASGEKILRHFASRLASGVDTADFPDILAQLVHYYSEWGEVEIERSSSRDVALYFDVFEMVDVSNGGNLVKIREDKKYLLKAAFMPLARALEDEVPF